MEIFHYAGLSAKQFLLSCLGTIVKLIKRTFPFNFVVSILLWLVFCVSLAGLTIQAFS